MGDDRTGNPDDDRDLDELERLREDIDRLAGELEAAYARRLVIWQRLRAERGPDSALLHPERGDRPPLEQAVVSRASRVGSSAVGFALSEARRRARWAAMSPEEQEAERQRAKRKGKRKTTRRAA